MANVAPSFVASGTPATSAAYSGRAISLTYPAGVAIDDICVIWMSASDNVITTPAGWTLQEDSGSPRTYLWTRVYDGTEGASEVMQMSGNATRLRYGVMHAFRGGDPLDPIDGSSSGTFAAATSHTPPSVTTAVDGTAIFTCFLTTHASVNNVPSLPAGATSIWTGYTSLGTDTASRHFAKAAPTAGVIAGALSTWTYSDTGSVASIGLKAVAQLPPTEMAATLTGRAVLLPRLKGPTPDFDSFLDSRTGRGTLVKVDVGDYDGSNLIRLEGGKS